MRLNSSLKLFEPCVLSPSREAILIKLGADIGLAEQYLSITMLIYKSRWIMDVKVNPAVKGAIPIG